MTAHTGTLDLAAGYEGDLSLEATAEATGEVFTLGMTKSELVDYARARAAGTVLRLELEELLVRLEAECPRLAELRHQIAANQALVSAVEADLGQAFTADARAGAGTLRLHVPGVVQVTWPKPARRWVQRVKPEQIARQRPDLAKDLGIEQVHSAPARPTIRLDAPERFEEAAAAAGHGPEFHAPTVGEFLAELPEFGDLADLFLQDR